MERVGPLLYWHFKNVTCWPPGIPKETAAALMGQYYATLGQNTLLFQELEKILEAFEQAEIPVVLLKGAVFLYEHQEIDQTVYPHFALRPMSDLIYWYIKKDLEQVLGIAYGWDTRKPATMPDCGPDWQPHNIHRPAIIE